jgi:hypothetical protein
VFPDEFKQCGVRLDRELAGPGPGRRHVPCQGQAAGPEMQHAQRLPGRCRQVDQVPEPVHVLELQVFRVLKVDVRLRCSVHQQRPPTGPPRVADKLGHPGINVLPDSAPPPFPMRHLPIIGRTSGGPLTPRDAQSSIAW